MTDAKFWIWNGVTPCISTSWGATCLGTSCAEKGVGSWWAPNRSQAACAMGTNRSAEQGNCFTQHSSDQIWNPGTSFQPLSIRKMRVNWSEFETRVTKVVSGLEFLTYEERLTEQGSSTLENRWLQRTSQQPSHIDKEFTEKTEADALVRCTVGKQETGAINWREASTRNTENKISRHIIKHWCRMPRETVECLPFKVFKTQSDKSLSNLIWNQCWSCFEQELRLETSCGSFQSKWFNGKGGKP